MLTFLLDNEYEKRMIVLNHLFEKKGELYFEEALTNKMAFHKKTLRSICIAINEDIKMYGIKNMSIEFDSKHKTYRLILSEMDELKKLEYEYLQNSLSFLLFNKLLTGDLNSIRETSKKLYVSYSHLRRTILQLDVFFQRFGIKIDTQKKIHLVGKESSIRVLYTVILSNIYPGKANPFSIPFSKIDELLNELPQEIYDTSIHEKKYLVQFYLLVSIVRGRQGKYMEEEIYQKIQPAGSEYLKAFNQKLQGLLFTNIAALERESNAILASIIALGTFDKLNRFSYFSYLQEQKTNLSQEVSFIMDILSLQLGKEMSEVESTLRYQIYVVHYRIYLLGYAVNDLYSLWRTEENKPTIIDKTKKKIINTVLDSLFEKEKYAYLSEFREYLVNEYYHIFNARLPKELLLPDLKVIFFSNKSISQLEQTFFNMIPGNLTVKVCKKFNRNKVDLIISDFSMSEFLFDKKMDNKDYFYMNNSMTREMSDYLLEQINQILIRKIAN